MKNHKIKKSLIYKPLLIMELCSQTQTDVTYESFYDEIAMDNHQVPKSEIAEYI